MRREDERMVTLDHTNIRSFDLAGTIAFYEDIVGLKAGAFPGSPGQGAWLYDDGGTPVIHVIAIDPARPEAVLASIKERMGDLVETLDPASFKGSGAIDHIAFRCSDYAGVKARIEGRKIPFRSNEVASFNLRQLFINDPSGIVVELNFHG